MTIELVPEQPVSAPVETPPSEPTLDPRIESFLKRWEWLIPRRKGINFWLDFVKAEYGERLEKEAQSILSGSSIDDLRALEKSVEGESGRLKEEVKREAEAKLVAMKKAQEEAEAKAAEEKRIADEARAAEKAAKKGKKRS